MSQIDDRVYAIERLPALGEAARRRFERLGYANVELRVGDGTTGRPDEGGSTWLFTPDRAVCPSARQAAAPSANSHAP